MRKYVSKENSVCESVNKYIYKRTVIQHRSLEAHIANIPNVLNGLRLNQ